ncbi:MAG: hypothetical protein EZS28_035217, partial [Streblomastix strix]
MQARAVKTTDEATGMKRRLLVTSDAQLAGFLAAIRTAHGLAAEAPCLLSYVDEDGDRIQISTDDDLAAATAQVQAGETFRVFVRSGEQIESQSSPQAYFIDRQNKIQGTQETKQQQKLAKQRQRMERNQQKRKEKQRENLERKAEKLKEKQKQQAIKQEQKEKNIQKKMEKTNLRTQKEKKIKVSSSESISLSSSSSDSDDIDRINEHVNNDNINENRQPYVPPQGQDGIFIGGLQANPYQYPNIGIDLGRIVSDTVSNVLNGIFRPPQPTVNNQNQGNQLPNSTPFNPSINQIPSPQCYIFPFIPPPQFIPFQFPFGGQFIPQSQQPTSTSQQQTSNND